MNEQELTAAILDLEHSLTNVWPWQRLFELGRTWDSDADIQAVRAWDREVQLTLVRCHSQALELVDARLAGIERGPLLDVLLERLCERILNVTGKGSFVMFQHYVEESWPYRFVEPDWAKPPYTRDPNQPNDNLTDDQINIEIDDYLRNYTVWSQIREGVWGRISNDLAYYGSKVADYIRRDLTAEVKRADFTADASLNRIQWNCSTAVYVHIVKELVEKNYIVPSGMNGKEGEMNITELFRRLSQAIIVLGKEGHELPPDELQRRWDGRQLALAKRARLTLPEAKEVK